MTNQQDPDKSPQSASVGTEQADDAAPGLESAGAGSPSVESAAAEMSSSSAVALPSLDEFDDDAAATLSVLRTQDQELNALLAAIDDDEEDAVSLPGVDLDDANLGVLAPEPAPRPSSRASQAAMKARGGASSMVGGSASPSEATRRRSASRVSSSAVPARQGSVSPGSQEVAGRALSSSRLEARGEQTSARPSTASGAAPPRAESGVWNNDLLAKGAVHLESVLARWDLYSILGVDEDAERDGMTMAYVERVNDVNTAYASDAEEAEVNALERIKAMLVQVYEVLADESKNAHYRAFGRDGMVPYRYYKLRMDDEPPLARVSAAGSSSTVRPARNLKRRARTMSGGRRIVLKTDEMEAMSASTVIQSRQKRSVGKAMGELIADAKGDASEEPAGEARASSQPLESFGGSWGRSSSSTEASEGSAGARSEALGASPDVPRGRRSGESPVVSPEGADDAVDSSEGGASLLPEEAVSVDMAGLDEASPMSLGGPVSVDNPLESSALDQPPSVSGVSPSLGDAPSQVQTLATGDGARVFSTPSMTAVGAVVFKTAEEMQRKASADQEAHAAELAALEEKERRTSKSQMKARKAEKKKDKAAKKGGLKKKAKRVSAFSGAEYRPEGDPFKGPLVFGIGSPVRGLAHSVLLFAVTFCISYIMVKFMGLGEGELALKFEEPMISARAGVLAVMALLGVVVVRRESPLRMGMLPNWVGILPAFAGAIIVGMVAGVIARFEVSGEDAVELLMAAVALRALGESLFFQGFLTRTMLIEFSQPAVAVFLSAIMYGLYSLTYAAFMDIDPGAVGYVAFIYAFGGGMPFALMYWQTRSIFMAFICQFTVLALTVWASWNHAVSLGI